MAIEISAEDIKRLEDKYGAELAQRALRVVDTYTMRIQRDAKVILTDLGSVDTGRLRASIKSGVRAYVSKVTGEVYTGTKYARFIHEGAKHVKGSSTELQSHFVRFAVAPSLLRWAKRHKKIEYIKGDWYFIGKDNQPRRISDLSKSGMMVYTKPAKFLEKPFLESKDEFINAMSAIVGGDA